MTEPARKPNEFPQDSRAQPLAAGAPSNQSAVTFLPVPVVSLTLWNEAIARRINARARS